jgi:anti-anti-sigma factor
MYEEHTAVTAGASNRAAVKEPERAVVGALAVRRERHADMVFLWLSGTLDRATSALLDREFDALAGRARRLVVDLTGLEFIDSRGLDTLVRAHRRASENAQRLTFRQGPHVGQRPLELIPNSQLQLGQSFRRVKVTNERNFFAHARPCADVGHPPL